MPPAKKKRLDPAKMELQCQFSECEDQSIGIEQFAKHVAMHVSLMKEQISRLNEEEKVDHNNNYECPWQGCEAILNVADNWGQCARHMNFHSFHTYLKMVGADQLQKRGVPIHCNRDTSLHNSIPELPDPFICQWNNCGYQSENPWLFYRHSDWHAYEASDASSKMRSCGWTLCSYTTKDTITKMKDHIRAHTQERRCACPRCGALYSMSTRLEDHQKREAVDEKTFECSHCSKKFSSERLLRDHLRKHVNMYGCMFCDMTCPSPSALRIHILYRHSTERPHSCRLCELKFKTKFDLASHDLTHEFKDLGFTCSVEGCDFNCKNISVLQKHTMQAHVDRGRKFGCHVCDQLYNTGPSLSRHLKTIHNLKYPSGHVKFRYAVEPDGIRRLVTVRYECVQEDDDDEEEEESSGLAPMETFELANDDGDSPNVQSGEGPSNVH